MDAFSLAPNLTAKLIFNKFPTVEFYTQKTPLPAAQAIYPKIQAPRIKVPMPPQSIDYSPFSIEFLLSEDCANYRALFDWFQSSLTQPVTDVFSDASLMLLAANRRVVQTVVFTDLLPIALGEITWVTDSPGVQYQKCNAIFDYTIYNFT